jgi:aminobenzoyl-glutamate utilization protein A
MIRADIDCVEVTESDAENHLPVREGFRSVNPGRHHACGHDGHTAMGLAAAELIARNRDSLKGRFRMIFQPAEEGVRGGYAMVKAGVADKADYLLSYHLGIGEPTGTIVAGMKDALNTTKFDVHIIGRGAHAGMEPHLGKNALLAACQASLGLFSIAPHKDGPSRINVGVLQAGEGRNVVPPKALMKCETRGQTPEVAAYMYNRAMQIVEGAAKMYDCGFRIVKQGESIGADPSEDLVNLIAEEAGSINGVKARLWGKMGGSDDAFWFVDRVTKKGGKATYMIIGADTAAGHHNESFDFDEKCMPSGVETIWRIVKRLNSK